MPQTVWTNADLTPAARRKRLGLEDHTDVATPADYASGMRGAALTTPDPDAQPGDPGFDWQTYDRAKHGEGEQDRLVAEAKATNRRSDPFMTRLQNAGTVAGQEALSAYDTPGEAMARSGGETAMAIGRGVAQVPGDLVKGFFGIPATIAGGYASIPEGLQAMFDEATWKGMPTAAKDSYLKLAADPETATRLFGGMIAAGPAANLAETTLARGPQALGRGLSKVGGGLTRAGESPLLGKAASYGPLEAIMKMDPRGLALGLAPDALKLAGKGFTKAGGALSRVDALGSLKKLVNKDVPNPFARVPTEEDLAAGTVRETVNTARQHEAGGATRGQAAQRAGWPLAGDFELDEFGRPVNKYGPGDFGHHPGQNVRAHWPYEPNAKWTNEDTSSLKGLKKAVKQPDLMDEFQATQRGPSPDATVEGRQWTTDPATGSTTVSEGNSLDGLRNAMTDTKAFSELSNPQSQRFMQSEYARNKPGSDEVFGRNRPLVTAEEMATERARQAGVNASIDEQIRLRDLRDRGTDPSSRLSTQPEDSGNASDAWDRIRIEDPAKPGSPAVEAARKLHGGLHWGDLEKPLATKLANLRKPGKHLRGQDVRNFFGEEP